MISRTFNVVPWRRRRHLFGRQVDREPLIRLYQANPRAAATAVPEDAAAQAGKPNTQPKKKKKRAAFERSSVAEWRGLLVAYEVLDWFKGLQHAGGPLAGRPQVAWGGDDALAEAMAAFKASDARHTGSPADPVALPPNAHADGHKPQDHDPNGYLVDLNSALALALRDDIFPIDGDSDGSDSEGGGAKLVGERLTTLIHFVEVLSFTHPTKAARSALATLRDELSGRPEWRPVAYEHLLATTLGGAMGRGAGYPEPPPTGHDVSLADGPATAVGPSPHWRWCRSNEAGVGGYPCGLWILFHTMLANSDGRRAHLTLGIVHAFVGRFYGCVECAVNFEAEWEHEGGADQTGHVPTSLWLWRVHNMVRARLTEEDDTLASPKTQWPSPAHCPACFSNATQQRWGLLPPPPPPQPPPPPETAPAAATTTAVPAQGSAAWERQARTAGSSLLEWEDALWSPEYVFSFLQETFCAASDTFVCQGFLDGRRA